MMYYLDGRARPSLVTLATRKTLATYAEFREGVGGQWLKATCVSTCPLR